MSVSGTQLSRTAKGVAVATRADVARVAGVSPSTVSYALSGARPLSLGTRDRVLLAARDLGYTPNRAAQSLASPALRTVGMHFATDRLLLNETDFAYVDGLSVRMQQNDVTVVIPAIPRADLTYLRWLIRSAAVGGIVLMDVEDHDPREDVLIEENVAAVLIGRSGRVGGCPSIDADFDEIARGAVELLHRLGHRRALGLMAQPEHTVLRSYAASLGRAFAEFGMAGQVIETPRGYQAGVAPAARVGAAGDYTAVITDNPRAGESLVTVAAMLGKSAPEDYSIVSLGVTLECGAGYATEYSPDKRLMGQLAGDMLLAAHQGVVPDASPRLLPGVLRDRGTCGPVPR